MFRLANNLPKLLLGALVLTLLLAVYMAIANNEAAEIEQNQDVRVIQVIGGLRHPWGLALLPGGDMLITERGGQLRHWRAGQLRPPMEGLPTVFAQGQGGLLDVLLHPEFANNSLIYLSYSKPIGDEQTTALFRARLDMANNRLLEGQDIFVAKPAQSTTHHYGSRMVFGHDGKLYMSIGDRGQRALAQNLQTHLGSIIRLNDDGSIPTDNPFVDQDGVLPEIYSYGHRNPQGMAVLASGDIWIHEHGARGGDEINQLQAGRNYGWPVITHGVAYSGFPIGEGSHKAGMEQPLWHWTPSIAPSGMAIYDGDEFAEFRGDTLVGSLKFAYLERLHWQNGKVVEREALIKEAIGRLRDVRIGQNGEIYLLNDEEDGGVYRLTR